MMPSADRDSFSFSSSLVLYFCLVAVPRDCNTMLNRRTKVEILFPKFPVLKQKCLRLGLSWFCFL